jgi:hypothetical protein
MVISVINHSSLVSSITSWLSPLQIVNVWICFVDAIASYSFANALKLNYRQNLHVYGNMMRRPDCWLLNLCSLWWSYIRSEDRCEMCRAWMKFASPCLPGIVVAGDMVKFKQQRGDNNDCKTTSIPCVSSAWVCSGWNCHVPWCQ